MVKGVVLADGFDLTGLQEVLSASNKRVAENERKSFYLTTKNWDHKPTFSIVPTDSYSGIQDYAVVTTDEIYIWVDEGTDEHTITAVNAPVLKYQKGFEPKTSFDQLTSSGSGKKYGEWTRRFGVTHSGIEARGFTERIKEGAKDRWERAIQTEIIKYVRKL